ncbi:MAG: bifunctional ligase/repressor BirA [Isosphaeraceae bacterium]|nr:MAG: bifunctional ligase/repressor BirA [Isosphaeraceae bacterium]
MTVPVSTQPALNIRLLEKLRSAAGPQAVGELGANRDRVLADLRTLQAFGFGLTWLDGDRVAYVGPASRLCPDQIEHELGTVIIGRRIVVWNRLTSTNDLAARLGATSGNEGLVVLAEEQTAGRGRRGRSWSAPVARSILMSVALRPPSRLADLPWLTALGAVAVAEVVAAAGVEPGRVRIKWPNDVLVGSRKVAGVLVERGAVVVVGIGLNVCQQPDEFPSAIRSTATSLALETGRDPLDRSELARALIQALDRHYLRALQQGPGALNEAWRSRLSALGRLVRLQTPAGTLAGRLADADLGAGLIIESADGTTQRVPTLSVLDLDPV